MTLSIDASGVLRFDGGGARVLRDLLGVDVTPYGARVAGRAVTAAPTAYQLDFTGQSTGDPVLNSGIWDAGTFTGATPVGTVSFSRAGTAWDAAGNAFTTDEPLWQSGLWVQPGFTRINEAAPPWSGALDTADSGSTVTDPLGLSATVWDIVDNGNDRWIVQGITNTLLAAGVTYYMNFWAWMDTADTVEIDVSAPGLAANGVSYALPVGWTRIHHPFSHATGRNGTITLRSQVFGGVVYGIQVAASPAWVAETPYRVLPALGSYGAPLTVAPDDLAVTLPGTATPKTLLLDVAEYRGGENGGCFVGQAGAGRLSVDPATGTVAYWQSGAKLVESVTTVAAGASVKAGLMQDGADLKLAVDGTVEDTALGATASLLPALTSATEIGAFDDSGTLRSSLAKYNSLTVLNNTTDLAAATS